MRKEQACTILNNMRENIKSYGMIKENTAVINLSKVLDGLENGFEKD